MCQRQRDVCKFKCFSCVVLYSEFVGGVTAVATAVAADAAVVVVPNAIAPCQRHYITTPIFISKLSSNCMRTCVSCLKRPRIYIVLPICTAAPAATIEYILVCNECVSVNGTYFCLKFELPWRIVYVISLYAFGCHWHQHRRQLKYVSKITFWMSLVLLLLFVVSVPKTMLYLWRR